MPGGAGAGGGMPGAGGGMPGFGGGMPGFGGGMPGGMPGMPPGGLPAMVAQLSAKLQQKLAAAGIRLPPGLSPQKAIVGASVAALVALYIMNRFISKYVLLAVSLAAYWGTQTDSGRRVLAKGSARVSAAIRRPLPSYAAPGALCLTVGVLGHMLLSDGVLGVLGGSDGVSASIAPESTIADAIRDAYQQGYDDGVAGADPRPPKPIQLPNFDTANEGVGQSSGSGFGLGSLMRYGMIASYGYNLGKTPGGWDPQLAMANAKANPMQILMMLMMVSGGGMF